MTDFTGSPDLAAIDELAGQPLSAADVLILQRLAALHSSLDPVPDDLVERIQFEISLDALNAELAELQHRPMEELAARGAGSDEVTTLTFTSDRLTTMISVTGTGADTVRIDGWLAPGGTARVELRQVSGQWETDADSDGRFVFEDVSLGLSRFVVHLGDEAAPVITPAVEL